MVASILNLENFAVIFVVIKERMIGRKSLNFEIVVSITVGLLFTSHVGIIFVSYIDYSCFISFISCRLSLVLTVVVDKSS